MKKIISSIIVMTSSLVMASTGGPGPGITRASSHEAQFEAAEQEAQLAAQERENSCHNREIEKIVQGFASMDRTGIVPVYRGRNLEIISSDPAPVRSFTEWYVEIAGKGSCKISPTVWIDGKTFPSIYCPSVGFQGRVGPIDVTVPGC